MGDYDLLTKAQLIEELRRRDMFKTVKIAPVDKAAAVVNVKVTPNAAAAFVAGAAFVMIIEALRDG